jgi:uncharacterized repeat protein (TIGR01451 family)
MRMTRSRAITLALALAVLIPLVYPSASEGQEADLAVYKTVNNPTPSEGDGIKYTVTVTNNGPGPAASVFATDILPADVTYVTHTTDQGTYSPFSGVWEVGFLLDGASAKLEITVTVNAGTAGTTITNEAGLMWPDPDPSNNHDSADITVQGAADLADLAITKAVDNAEPSEGDTIAYEVTVTNNGPNTATNAEVTDTLPAGVTYVSSAPGQGTIDDTGDPTIVWTAGTLTDGTSITLIITVTVDAGTAGTIITNSACVTAVDQADPDPSNDCATVDINVVSAAPEVECFVTPETFNVQQAGRWVTAHVTVLPPGYTNADIAGGEIVSIGGIPTSIAGEGNGNGILKFSAAEFAEVAGEIVVPGDPRAEDVPVCIVVLFSDGVESSECCDPIDIINEGKTE